MPQVRLSDFNIVKFKDCTISRIQVLDIFLALPSFVDWHWGLQKLIYTRQYV